MLLYVIHITQLYKIKAKLDAIAITIQNPQTTQKSQLEVKNLIQMQPSHKRDFLLSKNTKMNEGGVLLTKSCVLMKTHERIQPR